MKASDYIASFIEQKGIEYVFELSGGMITHILDSISQKTKVHIITMHHEQSAAFAADVYGRIKGIPGIALATSGPGATNLITGIGSCYFDSSPAIFITGQVNRHEQKSNRPIRQLGFQETDIVSMVKPITKAAYQIVDEKQLPQILEEAFQIATEGRPGPVLIDIPMDIQRLQVSAVEAGKNNNNSGFLDKALINELINAIQAAQKPLFLAGRGIRAAFATEELDLFLKKTQIPVVTSLLAVDTVEYDHPSRVGFIGSYGNRWANITLGECDLLIVAGSRLDIRQTGADTKFFESKTIFHIDCDAGEINNRIKGCHAVVADVKDFFTSFSEQTKEITFSKKEEWYQKINELRQKWPDTNELSVKTINPNKFVHQLSQLSTKAGSYLVDVGSHQMWAAQSVEIKKGQLFLTSGGMGAMGFALPAAIGACFALGVKPVVAIIGDGCMQINIQELQTIVRNKLPVKIVIMNNKNLGMIRQFQDSYFESRYQSTYWGYSAPDFEKVAEAYGISGRTVSEENEIEEALQWMWNEENENKPILLQVMIDPHTNTYPKIAFGKPITEMEPFAKPMDMEGT